MLNQIWEWLTNAPSQLWGWLTEEFFKLGKGDFYGAMLAALVFYILGKLFSRNKRKKDEEEFIEIYRDTLAYQFNLSKRSADKIARNKALKEEFLKRHQVLEQWKLLRPLLENYEVKQELLGSHEKFFIELIDRLKAVPSLTKRVNALHVSLKSQTKEELNKQVAALFEQASLTGQKAGDSTLQNPAQTNLDESPTKNRQGLEDSPAIELQKYLTLAGWEVKASGTGLHDASKAEFYVQQRQGALGPRRILVHHLSREAGSTDIEDLEKALSEKGDDEGWLIAESFYSGRDTGHDGASTAGEEASKRIRLFRPEELYFKELFNLESYFGWLKKECERLNFSRYNVAIDGSIDIDGESKASKTPGVPSLDNHITDWLGHKGKNHISILGDFGTGKTWFCWQYACKQLDEYRLKPQQERIPILIPLGDYKGRAEPEQLIKAFCEKHHVKFKDFKLFDAFNREGRFLIILDGLDEIVTEADKDDLADTFTKLTGLAAPNSKIILTSRRTLFKSRDERENLLGLHNHFEVIRLDEFDPDRIKEFLQRREKNWKAYWEKISGMGRLAELAKRPVMLEIILKVFKHDFALDEQITICELYKRYTDIWLEKVSRSDSNLDEAHRRRLMQVLAWKLYEREMEGEKSEIHYSKLPPLIQDASEQIRDWEEYESGRHSALQALIEDLAEAGEDSSVASHERDALNRSFLVRDASGNYSFVHRSILEYFVAQKLCRDLNERKKAAFALRTLSYEIVDFLRCLDFDPHVMLTWIEESRGEKSPLHGNVLTLLNKKTVDLRGQDFSRLHIVNADLGEANLEGCNFAGSALISVNVRDCKLNNTDFTGAEFRDLILGVRSPAKGVKFSPNGKYIASSRDDNAVVLLGKDRNEWKVEQERLGHKDSVTNVAFSNDGRLLASSSFDRTVYLWKLNGEKYFRLSEHEHTVYDIEFTPKGDYIFTASGNAINVCRITETKSRGIEAHRIMTLREHQAAVYRLAISADGEYLASASFDETVGVWKINRSRNGIDLEMITRLKGHKSLVNGVAFSPDSRFLASASNDESIIIWSVVDRKKVKTLRGHRGIVWDVAYSKSGRHLVSGSQDKTVKVWDVRTERVVSLEGHLKNVWSVCFSPDEELVASGSFDNTLKIWDWENKKCVKQISMGESNNQNFDCRGMRFTKDKGLSPFQETFLTDLGAIMEQ
jgi:WD40 repeat protein